MWPLVIFAVAFVCRFCLALITISPPGIVTFPMDSQLFLDRFYFICALETGGSFRVCKQTKHLDTGQWLATC